MDGSEEFGLMHQSVHPIEIRIMDKQHERKSQEIVHFSEFVPWIEKIGVILQDSKDQCGHGRKNQNGEKGEKGEKNIP